MTPDFEKLNRGRVFGNNYRIPRWGRVVQCVLVNCLELSCNGLVHLSGKHELHYVQRVIGKPSRHAALNEFIEHGTTEPS